MQQQCTHSQHRGWVDHEVDSEGRKTKYTFEMNRFHDTGPGVWVVDIEYPCCGHEGRKGEVWCELWTNTIFNNGRLPVMCPWCKHMYEDTTQNVKIIGLVPVED